MRRDRDSNPGRICILNGFRDRPVQPLRHLSTNYNKNNEQNIGFKIKKDRSINLSFCGEGGIRTHGTLRYTRFPSVRNRPLCHLSGFYLFNLNFLFKNKCLHALSPGQPGCAIVHTATSQNIC